MRILQVIRTLDPAWGGPVEGLKSLCTESTARGVESEVLCADDPLSAWLPAWTVPVHAVGRGLSTFGYTSQLDIWLIANLSRFDAVVVNGIWMYFSYAVWRATRKIQVPYYLFIHGALDPWFEKTYPAKHLKKIAYWRLIEHKVLRDAAAVLFTTEEEQRLAQDAFRPYRCNPMVVGFGIPDPPVDTRAFDRSSGTAALTAKYPQLENRNFLLYLARIHEKKGVDLLLRAVASEWATSNEVALVIAGPGDPKTISEFQALTSKLNLSQKVIWTGPLYGADKWNAMQSAEAYVLPSHQENFGISVVEALACGTPVLISKRVNIWREIDDAGAGLTAEDTVAGAAALLQQWKALNAADKQSMRLKARGCFLKHFDINANSCRLIDVIFSRNAELQDSLLTSVAV